MKLVSLQSLLGALAGIVLIIVTAIKFNDWNDLAWIILFGYLTIRGFVMAFSKEEYDAEIKKVHQRRALYSDLFGKFAFIAAYIPFIIIVLAVFLVVLGPDARALGIFLVVLLLIACAYALLFYWYTSKHKRTRMEKGEWDTLELTHEEAEGWKRAERWQNIGLAVLVVLIIVHLIFRNF